MNEGVFILNIFECKHLCSVHHSNLPDTFVKVMLLPDKKSKKKIRSIKDCLDPVFNEV